MNKHMAFSITIGLFAASAFAQQRIQTETVKGVAWSFSVSENGATITSGQKGKPAIPTSTGGDIAIPYKLGGNSVVAIGDDAFRGCTALTTVKIPMIVEGIGARAFYDCFSIKALELPRSCVSLGEQAFKGMTRMASITMKGGIAEIPDRLFQRCELLEEIVFPEGVEMLSGRVFEGCKKLHRVVFPKTLKTMDGGSEGEGMFGGVKELREVVFNGRPPEMVNVELPPKCTVRYDEQFATAWQRWKNDNPSITAFSLQDANASPDAGGDGDTASGEDSGDSDKNWLSIVETYVKPVTNENDAVSRIEELATGNSDTNLAARWFALAKSFQPDASSENSSRKRMEAIRKNVIKTAAAALICAGKSAVFKKEIAPQIDNLNDFEKVMRSPCEACGEYGGYNDDDNIFGGYGSRDNGNGKVKTKCQNCRGSGRCQYQGCNGGYVEVRKRVWGGKALGSESYSDGSKMCTSCNGSGQCRYCKGEGYLLVSCAKCGGKGWVIKKTRLLAVYRKYAEQALDVARDAVNDKEREERRAEERAEREERRERERERFEKERIEMEARGLEYIDGKWMTPGSVRNVAFTVLQIYEPGHALCYDRSGMVFCLLYSADDNIDIAAGDKYHNDLYRCGTYSYVTVKNAPNTVRQYAIDLEVALKEIARR